MSAVLSPIEEANDLLHSRLTELQDEQGRVERAIAALTPNGNGPTKRSPGRPKGSKAGSRTTRRRNSRKGGTRADEAVALITKKPGITASDVAKTMKIKPNYLYRVLGDLEKEKRVRKDGRTYFPV